METIEQGLRRIFKNAPHIYAECVRCAKERPNMNWGKTYGSPISGSHIWDKDSSVNDSNVKYWEELDRKANSGEQIGPDYPLPPDSPIRQKKVGNWYKYIGEHNFYFTINKWYECVGTTNNYGAFLNNNKETDGCYGRNHISFDLTNPLPHNPDTKPTLKEMKPKPEQAPEPTEKTEIKLLYERFWFKRNDAKIEIVIFYKDNKYVIDSVRSKEHDEETLLELQLEAVRFAKKRLNEAITATLE